MEALTNRRNDWAGCARRKIGCCRRDVAPAASGQIMNVHVLSDDVARLSQLREWLDDDCDVTTALLSSPRLKSSQYDAVVTAIDIRRPENIVALREMSRELARTPKRIFLINRRSRLALMQAYALGATTVLASLVNRNRLRDEILGRASQAQRIVKHTDESARVAAVSADYIRSMFDAVTRGAAVDVKSALQVGNEIISRIAREGLSSWLDSVRQHHEGTYQHCLLVAGVAADFGLSLGLGMQDMERLGLAAMLHDVGKASIPLAILDKPGRLNGEERKLIESHPAAGFDTLRANPDISAEILDAVRHHHEYLDGSGYPDKLGGNDIPDLTRILTISDIFAALIEYRPYKPTMSREKAFDILQSMQGKLEMPLVSAFRETALSR